MSDRDKYARWFRFPMGTCVRWADHPQERYYIVQRRWTQHDWLERVVEYRLQVIPRGTVRVRVGYAWAYESDLEPWPEEGTS